MTFSQVKQMMSYLDAEVVKLQLQNMFSGLKESTKIRQSMYPKSAEMTVLKQSKCKNKTLKI